MRKIAVVALVLFLGAAGCVYAAWQPPSADEMAAKMKIQLGLSDDQVQAVKPVLADFQSKRQALRQNAKDGDSPDPAVMQQMKALRDEENQKLSQILTPDQMAQLQKMQSQRRARRREERV